MPSRPATHKPMSRPRRKHSVPSSWGNGRGGRPWQRKRERVFNRDGFLCQICKSNGIDKYVTLHGSLCGICDHIIPKAEGGSDDESNLQTICKACDVVKTEQESKRGIKRGGKP